MGRQGIGDRGLWDTREIKTTDVVTMLPFPDEIVHTTMSGATLWAMLENSVSQLDLKDAWSTPDGRFLQLSAGITATWHFLPQRASGSRANGISKLAQIHVNGVSVEKLSTVMYTVATTRHLANGDYGYTMLPSLTWSHLGTDSVEAVSSFIATSRPTGDLAYWWDSQGDVVIDDYPPFADMRERVTQAPANHEIQIGIMCGSVEAGTSSDLRLGEREICDHVRHIASARLGSARLGSARLGSARLGSARLGLQSTWHGLDLACRCAT